MSFISFEFNWNHIYFLLHILSFFCRHYVISMLTKDDNRKTYEIKFFNIYMYTLSNLFSIFFHLISRKRSKRRKKKSDNNKLKRTKTDKSNYNIELIYSNEKPINFKKILKRTLLVSISDLLAQILVFLLNLFVKMGKVKLDFITIFNILSIYLFSRLLLNFHFYKHHKLSFYINIICIIIMGSVDIYNVQNWHINVSYYIIVKLLSSICYSFEDVIGKKALIEEFLSPYKILLYKSVYQIIMILFLSIPFFFIKIEGQNIFLIFIVSLNSIKKVLLVFLLMIINFAYNVFIWIINERFSPSDLSMVMAVEGLTSKIDMLLFDLQSVKDNLSMYIYEISFYFILAIGTCIHNEIIILHFCQFDEYTKKNLKIKSQQDFRDAISKSFNRPDSFDSDNQDINEKEDKENIMTELTTVPDEG